MAVATVVRRNSGSDHSSTDDNEGHEDRFFDADDGLAAAAVAPIGSAAIALGSSHAKGITPQHERTNEKISQQGSRRRRNGSCSTSEADTAGEQTDRKSLSPSQRLSTLSAGSAHQQHASSSCFDSRVGASGLQAARAVANSAAHARASRNDARPRVVTAAPQPPPPSRQSPPPVLTSSLSLNRSLSPSPSSPPLPPTSPPCQESAVSAAVPTRAPLTAGFSLRPKANHNQKQHLTRDLYRSIPIPPIPDDVSSHTVHHLRNPRRSSFSATAASLKRPSTAGGATASSVSSTNKRNLSRPRSHHGTANATTFSNNQNKTVNNDRSKSISSQRRRPPSLEPGDPEAADPNASTSANRRPKSVVGIEMARHTRGRTEDLFLELGNSRMNGDIGAEDGGQGTLQTRADRLASNTAKRFSLPVNTPYSPLEHASNGAIHGHTANRPHSRLHASTISNTQNRPSDRYRSPHGRNSVYEDDSVSVAGLSLSERTRRFSAAPQRSPISPTRLRQGLRSADIQNIPRGRSLLPLQREHELAPTKAHDSQDESPADSSEPKQAGSDSVESQTADTVWDELDDLKSRIKKLELTGKMPSTSSAAVSGGDGERPQTATTAPTTIDFSPKQKERKPTIDMDEPISTPAAAEAQTQNDEAPTPAHPLLDAALAKAKPLLNGALYRILEATATDALQLASVSGAGSGRGSNQGNAASSAHFERQIKRKADNMCRNLTDLCIALSEGKHESQGAKTPSLALDTSMRRSPPLRTPRSVTTTDRTFPFDKFAASNAVGVANNGRPISRLEARRSSILGLSSSPGGVPIRGTSARRESIAIDDYNSTSDEHESTAPLSSIRTQFSRNNESQQQPPRRVSRAPSAFLLREKAHLRQRQHQRDDEVSQSPPMHHNYYYLNNDDNDNDHDNDPTIRPLSRAMTDIGGIRARAAISKSLFTSPPAGTSPSQFSHLRSPLGASSPRDSGFSNHFLRRERDGSPAIGATPDGTPVTTPTSLLTRDLRAVSSSTASSPSTIATARTSSTGGMSALVSPRNRLRPLSIYESTIEEEQHQYLQQPKKPSHVSSLSASAVVPSKEHAYSAIDMDATFPDSPAIATAIQSSRRRLSSFGSALAPRRATVSLESMTASERETQRQQQQQ